MSDDWQPGDLALCIKPCGGDLPVVWEPAVGGVYTVAAYNPVYHDLDLEEDPCKLDPRGAFDPDCFRKIRPHTPDEEDRETIDLLNRAPIGEPA